MSIINDALKKAQEMRKESSEKNKIAPVHNVEAKTPSASATYGVLKWLKGKEVKKIIIFIVIIVAGGIIFFKSSYPPTQTATQTPQEKPVPATPETENPTAAAPSPNPSEASIIPTLTLNGIVYDEQRPYAIVNNTVLLKGDMIEGATLTEINKENVKFVFNGKEFELKAR